MHEVKYSTEFQATHHLPGHPTCGEPHDHDYTIEVIVSSEKADRNKGMVIDYFILVQLVKDKIISSVDGTDLNESLPNYAQPPTAENIAEWAYNALKQKLTNFPRKLEQVTIGEIPEFSATYRESES